MLRVNTELFQVKYRKLARIQSHLTTTANQYYFIYYTYILINLALWCYFCFT